MKELLEEAKKLILARHKMVAESEDEEDEMVSHHENCRYSHAKIRDAILAAHRKLDGADSEHEDYTSHRGIHPQILENLESLANAHDEAAEAHNRAQKAHERDAKDKHSLSSTADKLTAKIPRSQY